MEIIKKCSLIFLLMFLPFIIYGEETSVVIKNVKIILDEGTWIPQYSLDVLKSKNRDYMSNFVKNVERFTFDITEIRRLDGHIDFDSNDEPDIFFWYEGDLSLEPIEINKNINDKYFFRIGNQNYITISDAAYVGEMVKFSGELDKSSAATMLNWSKLTAKEDTFDMFFIFDGDYLDIYIDEVLPENLFYTFASINDATVNEFKTLMISNTCNLSNVTWPRYANGSSDYDDRIILKDKVGNHEVGKNYLTTDNLRFREKEGVVYDPLFTLPKDTPVKILKLGVTEIIDNITADWLQVEVAKDTVDIQGEEVKKGAVGWCFGGYLTTTPVVIVEPPEVKEAPLEEVLPELGSTEQTIPIIIWIIGGAVLLLGAIGVAVVRKKKK